MEITAPDPLLRPSPAGVDLADPGLYRGACQHALWRTMREHAPVHWQSAPNGTGFWSVTRYADCDRILRDHQNYSSVDGTILASVGIGDPAGGLTITLMDPPEHTAIRKPAMRLLGGSGVRRRLELIRARVDELLSPLAGGGEHDFAGLVRLLPMTMFGDMMGVPKPLWPQIAHWAHASIAPEDPEFRTGNSPAESMRNAHHSLFELFTEALRHSRRNPGDDLLTILSAMEPAGQPMSEWQILLNCYSYILGAHSTTPHVAAHTLSVLARREDLWDAVAADRSLIPALVDEGARWTSPTHHLVRRADAEAELDGATIKAGDWVCAWVASANRDEEVFADPYAFRLDRERNPHLSFGVGAHFCIGTHLSKAGLTMAFEWLFTHVRRVEPTGVPTHLLSNWINGLTRMPVAVHPG
ncbi:cytochrome P450 [Acrocarpospora phusangensis]|uniref:Cytochrome P450 n=1 Tax=Acrocarpospora phusangensis TaxID=1070424 RepID=A0A919QFF8_9ACTN|nr:cytochrome P450 [Acrocarpospora phusangensis]GIH25272.1 cytochrome P450 [Acrocarpospora phusangensis]